MSHSSGTTFIGNTEMLFKQLKNEDKRRVRKSWAYHLHNGAVGNMRLRSLPIQISIEKMRAGS